VQPGSPVQRAVPASASVAVAAEDVDGVAFVAVPRPSTYALLGRVRADAAQLPQLTAELTRAGEAGVLQSLPVGAAGLVEFRGLEAGRYAVALRAGAGLRALRSHVEVLSATGEPTGAAVALADVPAVQTLELRFTASERPLAADAAPPALNTLAVMAVGVFAALRRQQTAAIVSFVSDKARGLVGRRSADASAAAAVRNSKKPKAAKK
jgi:hypothetical protein